MRTAVCAVIGPVVVVTVTDKVIARLRDNHRQANLAVIVVDVSDKFTVRSLGTARNIDMRQDAVFRFSAQITPHKRLTKFRPIVVGPHDIAHLYVRITAIILIVIVIHKALAVHVLKSFTARRPVIAPITAEENRATAIQKRLARAVYITAVNAVGAPDSRLVRVVFEISAFFAAVVPSGKEEILAVVFNKACAFDACTTAVCDVLHFSAVFHLARFFVQFENMDARAPRTKRHPDFSVKIFEHRRVNCVVRITLDRVNHFALVRPAVAWLCRVDFLT